MATVFPAGMKKTHPVENNPSIPPRVCKTYVTKLDPVPDTKKGPGSIFSGKPESGAFVDNIFVLFHDHHLLMKQRQDCQGRNEMPQDRRSKVPQKRRFENSPASVVLLHRGRRGKMTEHAGFQFLFQAIALTANIDGDGMVQQAIQDGRRDHMVVKNVAPGAVALVAG